MAKIDAGRLPNIAGDEEGGAKVSAQVAQGAHVAQGRSAKDAKAAKAGRKSVHTKKKAHTFSKSSAAKSPEETAFQGFDAVVPQTAKTPVGQTLADALPVPPPVANPANPALHTANSAAATREKLTTSIPNSAQQTQTQDAETYQSVFSSLAPKGPQKKVQRTGTPTISMRNVTVVYPARPNEPALEDVSLDVYPGEFVFLVGHSGSGKSTFLKLLTREIIATDGHVMVAGQELGRMRNWKVPYLRRQIGCVFQDFKLLPDKTTYENVAFSLECIGKPRSVVRTQVPEVLRLVGLAEKTDMYPDQLSGGEQQRVSVARAMVNRPPLLVCDEPTGNLDPAISLGIMKLLERINRTGTTVVMATHDREMVDSMKKRVIALEAGHIIRDQEEGGYGYYGAL